MHIKLANLVISSKKVTEKKCGEKLYRVSQTACTSSKLTIEAQEQGVKYIQS